MSDDIRQIARRIKELRKIAGLSTQAIAETLKISQETYRKYEAGNIDIPISVLYGLARKFNVEMTALLTGQEPHLHTYCLVKKGSGPATDRRKEYKYRDLAYNFAHKKAEAFLVTAEPKPTKHEIHFYSHPGQEFNYVLKGALKVILDGHEIVLDEGDSLYFNSGLEHAMVALNRKPAKFLAVIL